MKSMARLLSGFVLGALAATLAACSLASAPITPDYSATQTAFAVIFTQFANTPTLLPPPESTDTPTPTPISLPPEADSPTPTATLENFPLTHIPEILPTFFTPGAPTAPPPSGPRPLSYTLQAGEYPWCIARRFNVDPNELLALNNLRPGMIYAPGLVLSIPQSGRAFPGTRALRPHPAAYTVSAAQTTVYRVACYFGDVDPLVLMQHNGLTSPILTFGQVLQIP